MIIGCGGLAEPRARRSRRLEELAGYRVAHTQASIRLPDKGDNAYFMFSASKDKHGSIWVVRVPMSNGVLASSGTVVWSEKYANGCTRRPARVVAALA